MAQDPIKPGRLLSRLESLPGELRNRIYRYAVVKEGLVQAVNYTFVSPFRGKAHKNEPSLARVCRDLRREVLPIYYGENTFTVFGFVPRGKSLKNISNWVSAIDDHVHHVKQLGYSVWVRKPFSSSPAKRNAVYVRMCAVATLADDMRTKYEFCPPMQARCMCLLAEANGNQQGSDPWDEWPNETLWPSPPICDKAQHIARAMVGCGKLAAEHIGMRTAYQRCGLLYGGR